MNKIIYRLQERLIFDEMRNRPHIAQYLVAGSIALITFFVYLPALQNDFVNWDDGDYIYENPSIKEINIRFLKWAFNSFHAANWHPLTWISHAIDYALWGLNPFGHHLTSIILHAANAFLVVVLVARLVEAAKPLTIHDSPFTFHFSRFTLIAAATSGLLFGIHPLHVESVAWISERKDLLCALFFLLSIMAYLNAVKRIEPGAERNSLTLGAMRYALCFFVLALLSKPMAVTLPLVLVIIDWYPSGRIQSIKTFKNVLMEKLPFFLLSLFSSVITILAQRTGKAIVPLEDTTLATRLVLGAKALVLYPVKVLMPVDLLPFYPYPKDVSLVSFKYGLMVVVVIGISAACIAAARKQKLWPALWLYYVITLVPVLGIVQVGGQSMADRYAYLPTLVLFFIAGLGLTLLLEKVFDLVKWRTAVGIIVIGMSCLIIIFLSSASISQTRIWKSSIALWSYLIEREPQKVPLAYYNRGLAYGKTNQLDLSIDDFTNAIAVSPRFGMAYNNRGVAYFLKNMPDSAFVNFNKAIELDNDNAEAYINRAYVYLKTGKNTLAVSDLRKGCDLGNVIGCEILKKVL